MSALQPLTAAMPVGALVQDAAFPDDPGFGVVVEAPAVDPDGDAWPDLATVWWYDMAGFDLVEIAGLRTAVPR